MQDNTDNNVQDLKNQLAAEQQRQAQQTGATTDPALAAATQAQQAAAAKYSSTGQTVPCVPGQPCAQANIYGQQAGQPSISLRSKRLSNLAAKERELAYNSRFASNLVYAHQPQATVSQQPPAGAEVPTVAGYSQTPGTRTRRPPLKRAAALSRLVLPVTRFRADQAFS